MYNVVPIRNRTEKSLSDVFDRMFSDIFDDGWFQKKGWIPPIDFYEDEKQYTMTIELPGVAKEDVEITVNDGILTVAGEKKSEPTGSIRKTERFYGKFYRSFNIPSSADAQQIQAKFEGGILSLTIPKLPAKQAQKIKLE